MNQAGLFAPADLPGYPFGSIRPFSAGVLFVDPPWAFENRSEKGEDRNASQHYPTMSVEEITALPVSALADKDCALFLWVTGPVSHRWPAVMSAWGFKFSGKAFCWAKPNDAACAGPVDDICADGNWKIGLGYGTRHNTEDCWLGLRGSPPRLDLGVRELIIAPVREHSRKPDEAYARAQRLFAGPYVELFGRETREGWLSWGNETGKFNPC